MKRSLPFFIGFVLCIFQGLTLTLIDATNQNETRNVDGDGGVDNDNDNLFCEDGVCTRISNEPAPKILYEKDTHENCKQWAYAGECEANPRYMTTFCAESCLAYVAQKVCRDNDERHSHGDNDDYEPDIGIGIGTEKHTRWCRNRAEAGLCLLDREHMTKHCEETCMFCISDDDTLRANGISDEEIERRRNYISMDFGEHQEKIGRDNVELYNSRQQIIAMDKYTKQNITSPLSSMNMNMTPKGRKMCTNTMKECSYYASKGMCKSRTIFMMSNCPLACMMCEELELFHHCVGTRHPFNNPLFVALDTIEYIENAEDIGVSTIQSFFLDTLFNGTLGTKVQIITHPSVDDSDDRSDGFDGDGDFRHSRRADEKAHQHHQDPYMVLIEDFLSPNDCDKIVTSLKSTKEGWNTSPVHRSDHFNGKHGHQVPQRKSFSLECGHESELKPGSNYKSKSRPRSYEKKSNECPSSDISDFVIEKLSHWMGGISSRHFEPMKITHYPPGGYYTLHEDYNMHDEWKPTGARVLSIHILISDTDGSGSGSFGFPSLDKLLVTPKRGTVLVWSNVDDSLTYNGNLIHEIMPVRDGDVYILSTHIHQYDYVDSVEQGCVVSRSPFNQS